MRLIDADALETHEMLVPLGNGQYEYTEVVYKDDIDTMPTIEPQKKGKWIEQDDGWDGVYYECSECREAFTLIDGTPTDNLYNFCPNCGADMRGDTE